MLSPQIKKVKYALLAANIGGLDYLFKEIKQRAYRQETFIGLAKSLNEPDFPVRCKIEYSLRLAAAGDIEDMVLHCRDEGKEATFDIIQRKWFFESGFHNCYVARAISTGEICYLQWAISLRDSNAESQLFKSTFPRLKSQDLLLEHAYTFRKFRGNKIMPSVMNQLFQIARQNGFARVITYVLDNNPASLKACYTVGFQDFEIVRRTKLPFITRYQITEPAVYS